MTNSMKRFHFPVLFPKSRFGYRAEGEVIFSPTKHFNARLLYHIGSFAMNTEYVYFSQVLIEQKMVSDSISIALTVSRPGFLQSSTAGGGGADSAPLCNFLI